MALIGPVIQRRDHEHLLELARLISQAPADTPDRAEEAQRLMRRALVEHSLGRISDSVRAEIVRRLAFAIDRAALQLATQRPLLTSPLEPTAPGPGNGSDLIPNSPRRDGV